jgi:hypothetical protein
VRCNRSSIVTTTGQLPRIGIDEILAVGIDLPPLPEQRRIASILQRQLKPGARIVSHRFDMGDWKPDKTAIVPDCATAELRSGVFEWRWCTALLWIVPAKIEGSWRLPQGELVLEQQFQMVSGTLGSGGTAVWMI